MTEIPCQRCKPGDDSCATCGGTGKLLHRVPCASCGTLYWTYPGAHTVYEGKRFHSFDGLEIICHMAKPNECARCVK